MESLMLFASKLISFFENHSTEIKDLVSIACTIVATVVAVKTYQRAKSTIFQTETIKRQSNLLLEILDIFGFNNKPHFMIKTYYDIILCNIYEQAAERDMDFGLFPFNDNGEINDDELNRVKGLRNGWLMLNENSAHLFTELFQDIQATVDSQLEKKENTSGIDIFYLTNDYHAIIGELDKYIRNPFLPRNIGKRLETIKDQINSNVQGPLCAVFNDYFCYLMENIYTNDKFWPQTIHNAFLKHPDFINHREEINALISDIRKYLKIDEM